MPEISAVIDEVYRNESRKILATLVRLLRDLDLAEDALQDAFVAASEQWPTDGIPQNPRAWLVSTGRFRAIDKLRRAERFAGSLDDAAATLEAPTRDHAALIDDVVQDDELRLIFTCCHPALAPESRVALTLREVCGLTTEEIARAFLVPPATLAQRIVRAKSKIRTAGIPYRVPSRHDLPYRIDAVLDVVYLVFNEGYSASFGDTLTRSELSDEAIRLGRVLVELLPEPEVLGLLALMLLVESRRDSRTSPEGEIVLLEDQDRSKWNATYIQEGTALVERALAMRRFGPFCIQAAIAALHSEALHADLTDWQQIAALYEVLYQMNPTPIVELNRAVAIAMRDGPQSGIELIDAIVARGELTDYHPLHAARAELCRRAGIAREARASYERALALVQQTPEKRFLEKQLKTLI